MVEASPPRDLVAAIARHLRPGLPVAVAFSGGGDSTALLHSACVAAQTLGVAVHALHVDHALQSQSAQWRVACQSQCERWRAGGFDLRFHARRLDWVLAAGDSLEAAARRKRYQALAELARTAGCATVLLAQHRDDQVETFLLQALRGAGAAGLSAMPAAVQRDGIDWLRPWLARPRSEIDAYRVAGALDCIDDPSNQDQRLARNRLRHAVLPVMRSAFPQTDVALQAAVAHAQDAAACLSALAELDLAALRDGATIRIAPALELGGPRLRNLLRHWLLGLGAQAPAASLLHRLSLELTHCDAGSWPHGAGLLSLHQGGLHWRRDAASLALSPCGDLAPGAAHQPASFDVVLQFGANPLPEWGGVLWVEWTRAGGVDAANGFGVTLRPRGGGERFQSHAGGVPRALKKQYQAAGVPRWSRDGPLVYRGEDLLWVPGLGVDARRQAAAGARQWVLRWEAKSPTRSG
ncbi:MAG: tRNA lysidine(34) synthetase TilS [Leptothrix sp. (in: b-proteobacteria)]